LLNPVIVRSAANITKDKNAIYIRYEDIANCSGGLMGVESNTGLGRLYIIKCPSYLHGGPYIQYLFMCV